MDNLFELDTTERVCPECNGNLRHTVNSYKETHWTCKQCRIIFGVPNRKDWSRIYIRGFKAS